MSVSQKEEEGKTEGGGVKWMKGHKRGIKGDTEIDFIDPSDCTNLQNSVQVLNLKSIWHVNFIKLAQMKRTAWESR